MTDEESVSSPAVGNDGLTNDERQAYADAYRKTLGKRSIPAPEKHDIEAWLTARRTQRTL